MTVGTTQLAPGNGHNYIINGAFDVFQRGDTVIGTSSSITYVADRWMLRPNSSTQTTAAKSTDAPTGLNQSILLTRDSGQTGTFARFQSALETEDIASLRGRVATVSFWAKKDSGFTGTTTAITLFTGDGTERIRGISAYDNETTPISDTFTTTTSWQRFQFTSSTLITDLSQLTLEFGIFTSGTAPANDGIFITGVQLEAGSVATPFKRNANSIQGELAACQRYFQKFRMFFGTHFAGTSTAYREFESVSFKPPMRATPSISVTEITNIGVFENTTIANDNTMARHFFRPTSTGGTELQNEYEIDAEL